MAASRIAHLSGLIAVNVAKLEDYLKEKNLPVPSFDVDGPVNMNHSSDAPEIEAARIAAIEASIELSDLLQGPILSLRPIVNNQIKFRRWSKLNLCQMNGSSLQAIYRFDIANKVPIHGDISYEELTKLCQIRESDLCCTPHLALLHGFSPSFP